MAEPLGEKEAARFAERVEQTLYASKRAGGEAYGWDVDLGAVTALRRAGRIVRAAFLDRSGARTRRGPGW